MKKFKKIAICFIMLVFVFVLTGCAQIEYSRIVNTDGSIIDSIGVKLDGEALKNAGFTDLESVKNDIKTKMYEYLQAFFNAFKVRDDGLLEIEKIAVKNNVTSSVTENGNVISASLKFRNYNAFKYFYGLHLIDSDENDNSNVSNEFLYNKITNTGKTIFSSQDAAIVTNDIIDYFRDNFALSDATLIYTFATPESKLHSNADNQFEENGIYYHQWALSDENQEISTFTYQIKPVNWYVLALGLTGALILILAVISLMLKNKNKDNKVLINQVNNQNKVGINVAENKDEKLN